MPGESPQPTPERLRKMRHRAGIRHSKTVRATFNVRSLIVAKLQDVGLQVTPKQIAKLTRHDAPLKWSAYGIWDQTGMQHPIMSRRTMMTIAHTKHPLKLRVFKSGLIEIDVLGE